MYNTYNYILFKNLLSKFFLKLILKLAIVSQAAQSLNVLYILNIYTEYLTVIIFNNEIIQKILTVYVKNISNLLIEYICCVSESRWCDFFTFSSYLNGRQYWHWTT
jgi:hypothetical protein